MTRLLADRYRRAAYQRWREARPVVDKIPQHRLPA
jgi:hypothetical protein